MHVKAKKMAFGGLLLALTVLFMALGSVIESNTLFLLAAASFFVGIVIREAGLGTGAAFFLAGVVLGFILAPNKLYVISYAAMGFYILVTEFAWSKLFKAGNSKNRGFLFWVVRYIVFNLMYIPAVLIFEELLFARELSPALTAGALAIGQIGLFIYDRAYEYVQMHVYGRMRGRLKF